MVEIFFFNQACVLQARAFAFPPIAFYEGEYTCVLDAMCNYLGYSISEDAIKKVGRSLYHRNRYEAILPRGIQAFLKAVLKSLGLDIPVQKEIALRGDDPMGVIFSHNCPDAVWAHQDVPGRESNHDMIIRERNGSYYVFSAGETVLLTTFVEFSKYPITHLVILE